MGDYFQSIVAKKNEVDNPEELASKIVFWLVEESIIEGNLTDCVLGGSGLGYRPGLNYKKAVERHQSELDPRELWTCGLEIRTKRAVFDSGQGLTEVRCPECKTIYRGDWTEVIDEWYEGKGTGAIVCADCGRSHPVIEWNFEPIWGFSNLGFTFWNWPRIKTSFIQAFSEKMSLDVVYVYGKL